MLDFHGQRVLVTGAGGGLGRQYARDFAAAGARVAVHARTEQAARAVVEEIGGDAVAVAGDARAGGAIVAAAVRAYGGLDALVVNAGQTRDRTYAKMSDAEWDEVLEVHVGGARTATAAAWPHLVAAGGGRIVLTTSGAGLHGNVGQANYAAAKAAILGLTKTLALEGRRRGVLVNAVAPMAHTAMTDAVFDDELRRLLPATAVSPFVLALAHPSCPRTGAILEVGGGWAAELRWQRSAGVRFADGALTPQAVLDQWSALADYDRPDYPASTADCLSAATGRPEPPRDPPTPPM